MDGLRRLTFCAIGVIGIIDGLFALSIHCTKLTWKLDRTGRVRIGMELMFGRADAQAAHTALCLVCH
jgi:hypothetical protein